MLFYVQVDKISKRVTGYSSNKVDNENLLEIQIDDNNIDNRELLINPYIFKIDSTGKFIKDIEFQNKLIEMKKAKASDKQKITELTQLYAQSRIENMKKDNTINLLIKERAVERIEKMKEGSK